MTFFKDFNAPREASSSSSTKHEIMPVFSLSCHLCLSGTGFRIRIWWNKAVAVYFAKDLRQRVRISGPLQNAQKGKNNQKTKITERSFFCRNSIKACRYQPFYCLGLAICIVPTWRKNCVEGEWFDWCLARRLPASGHLSTCNLSRFKWPAAREIRSE